MHLVIRNGDETALWVLTPAGQRTAKVTYKPEYGAPFGPPMKSASVRRPRPSEAALMSFCSTAVGKASSPLPPG